MDLGKVIYTLIKNAAPVTAIIGSGDNCRAYPARAKQVISVPYVTWQRITAIPNETKGVVSTVDTVRYQVNVIADSQTQLEDLSTKVRSALDGQAGSISGVVVQEMWYSADRDDYNDGVENDGVFMRMQDYIIRAET